MARPQKEGLDYFPHDTDLSTDDKIESVEAVYGNDGYSCYCKLLERIYRLGKPLIISDAETYQKFARKCNLDVDRFKSIIAFMVKIGLFDSNLWKKSQSLWSFGIEKRYELVNKKRVAAKMAYNERHGISDAETIQETNQGITQETYTESTQSKEKERKEKNKSAEADFSAVFIEKAKKAISEGLNIYALLNRFYKVSKLREQLPEQVLDSILDDFFIRKDSIKEIWPYFTTTLKEKSRLYFANKNQLEHENIKNQPQVFNDILKTIAEKQ